MRFRKKIFVLNLLGTNFIGMKNVRRNSVSLFTFYFHSTIFVIFIDNLKLILYNESQVKEMLKNTNNLDSIEKRKQVGVY